VNGARVGNQCSLVAYDWMRDRGGRSARRIFKLGQQPLRNRDSDPTERRQPADHRDGNPGQIADLEKPLL
jgi:hypothetical protein